MSESITSIKEKLSLAQSMEELLAFHALYKTDERKSVQSVVLTAEKKIKALQDEIARTEVMKKYEKEYSSYGLICGIDEVGRGPLAGPVVTAAVILPENCQILYLNDSKKLTEKKREELYEIILRECVAYAIGIRDAARIDEINILQATYEAMRDAVLSLDVTPDILLNDAVTIPGLPMKQVPIVKGDAKSVSIAAASIVAKVTRDRMMVAYEKEYPGYGFASNKGYGSAAHIQALKELGPTVLHRRSFIGNFI